MSLHSSLLQSARACEGAAFALAHSLRRASETNPPPGVLETYREAEAFAITTRAVIDEAGPLLPLLKDDAVVLGRQCNLFAEGAQVHNGIDSLGVILRALFDTAVDAILDVAGNQSRWLVNRLQMTAAFERMVMHHGQLRALYGIVHVAGKLVSEEGWKEGLFGDGGGVDPARVREAIRLDDFYGRWFGFHYGPEMRNVLRVVNIMRGSIKKSIEGEGSGLLKNVSLLGWGWVYSNMVVLDSLGVSIEGVDRIGNVGMGIEGVRKFMNLVEEPLVAGVSGLAGKDVALNIVFEIPGGMTGEGELGVILGQIKKVKCRVVSLRKRPVALPGRGGLGEKIQTELDRLESGMRSVLGMNEPGMAKSLILHFHGGGFVSQSSESHLVYLREWCGLMEDVVILSVDYSLAPESRWPTALYEGVYAYLWALRNGKLLGCDCETVVFTGDSAGGNLAIAAAMLVNRLGLRGPEGICAAYPALYVKMAWSVSRLLSFFDPLLPLSVLQLCLKSYVPEGVDGGSNELISPLVAKDEVLKKLPRICLICGSLDPLLDDTVSFADRLRRVREGDLIKVYEDMPHGLFNLCPVSEVSRQALKFTAKFMADCLGINCKINEGE